MSLKKKKKDNIYYSSLQPKQIKIISSFYKNKNYLIINKNEIKRNESNYWMTFESHNKYYPVAFLGTLFRYSLNPIQNPL